HFGFDILATRPTMVKERPNFSNRFDTGGGFSFSVRSKASHLVSVEAGVGLQQFFVQQRNEDIVLSCNLPTNLGGAADVRTSYLDAKINLASVTMYLATIIHFNCNREGLYLKPKIRFNHNIGDQANGRIYACGAEEAGIVGVGRVYGKKLTVYPGLGIGCHGPGINGKLSYLETNLALSARNAYSRDETERVSDRNFWQESGVLIGGVTIGWKVGGGTKKRRRLKKE
ncbi:MAG: hypothetical protein ACI9K9_000546, partial [Neolewinella sp.]